MLLPVGDDIKRRTFPFVNIAIILANVVVFALVATRPDYDRIVYIHGFVPAQMRWDSLFTSMFLHADFLHLMGNMIFLAVVGDNVEDRFGHVTYLFFYVLCGVVAVLAQLVFSAGAMATAPMIGASGAVSGAMGAYLVLYPFHQMKLLLTVIPIRVPAFAFIGLWVASQWAMKIAMDDGAVTRVAVWAHLGGFAFGFAVTVLLRLMAVKRRSRSRE
ncbi:MAG: rhomboid family intramembrane serine protease [Planctomycetes bacterium]|nr:rhomboid family intramembrane serine protease [Planctomycetota bacterium]